jgi:hypothetical protein
LSFFYRLDNSARFLPGDAFVGIILGEKVKAAPIGNGIGGCRTGSTPLHAVPDEGLLWPGFRFACAPELVEKIAIAVSNTRCAIPRGGTTTAEVLNRF